MSVIAEIRIAAREFELGRILDSVADVSVELETMVPLRQRPVPFVNVHSAAQDSFEEHVRKHPSVERIQEVDSSDDQVLYALDWDASRDHLFNAMEAAKAQLMAGSTVGRGWEFELRFQSHDALSAFEQRCDEAQITYTVERIYNPTKPTSGPWFGLTDPQRRTLVRAVEGGYYSIPREMSTNDLAAEFGVSDQAITERLRRAIVTLAENTVCDLPEDDEA